LGRPANAGGRFRRSGTVRIDSVFWACRAFFSSSTNSWRSFTDSGVNQSSRRAVTIAYSS
jgi:hypothetical protein